jgi:LmbE family N-acetylglucosaminyl deacetylase
MNAIGVDEGDVHFLSYEHRKLAQAPLEEYAARDGQAHSPASSAGGEFRPAGDERHPDHVAMSRLKSDAIAAADSRWYPEAVHGYPELTLNEEAFRLA